MYPLFRFTLNNSVKGVQVVDDPDGWDEIALILERDKEFHSIIEGIETPLVFYSTGKDYILDVLDNQGADSTVELTIELSTDEGTSYDTIFEGVFALEKLEEQYRGTQSHLVKVPIIQNEFWQKFKNRFDTPVEVGSTTDLDGGTRQAISSYTLNLPDQVIDKYFKSSGVSGAGKTFHSNASNVTYYYIVQHDKVDYNEWNEYYNYPNQLVTTSPVADLKYFWKAEKSGSYIFDIDYFMTFVSENYSITPIGNWIHDIYFDIYNYNDTLVSSTTLHSNSGSGSAQVTDAYSSNYTSTRTLSAGDKVYIYGKWYQDTVNTGGGAGTANFTATLQSSSSIEVVFKSTYPDTTCEAFKIHEVGNSITNLITGQDNSFYSEFLGNTSTTIQTYLSNGDGSYNDLTQGINVRGKTFTEKPFYLSFKSFWDGVSPLFNTGLGYENQGGNDIVRIEEVEHFYQSNPHITLSNIEGLIRIQNEELFIKTAQIGFSKWKSEEIGALDDPQTVHDYALRFKTFGKDVKLLSSFYGAGIGIEQARRRETDLEDYKLDDEIIIINIDSSSLDTPALFPSGIVNINNSTKRYNLRLTPKRALLRHMNILSAGLTKYTGSEYKFSGGEGNVDMASTISTSERGDYNNIQISENADAAWDYGSSPLKSEQQPIFTPDVYEFEYPLTYTQYESFRDNSKRSFNISSSASNHFEVFLDRLEYNPSLPKSKFRVIKAYA